MTSVLGKELSCAEKILHSEGFNVSAVCVSCRKGMDGNEKRVIREKKLDDGTIELCYSVFKTEIAQ